jgi:predicted tellurium resistance membrane protein TerC
MGNTLTMPAGVIGTMLMIEGLHQHIPKGYVYFAMAFAVFVEMLNLRLRQRQGALVQWHQPSVAEALERPV